MIMFADVSAVGDVHVHFGSHLSTGSSGAGLDHPFGNWYTSIEIQCWLVGTDYKFIANGFDFIVQRIQQTLLGNTINLLEGNAR
jgi:hypothetical protein